MIRKLTPIALGIAVSLMATGAFAQDDSGGGDAAPAGDSAAAPSGDKAAPAGDAAKSGDAAKGGGDAAASASASTEGADAGGKIKLGLRVGYALPMGGIATVPGLGDLKMSDYLSGQIPIQLDLGYMVTPNILVGLYAQYGILMVKSDKCNSCSGADLGFGLQGQYHISPGQSLDPWVGLGVGYEITSIVPSGGSSTDYKGLQFLDLQGGADFKVSDSFTVGPFLSFSLGQYSSVSSGGASVDITNKAMHEWLTLGVKGTFGI